MKRLLILVVSIPLFAAGACRTGPVENGSGGDTGAKKKPGETTFRSDQPEYPDEKDDAYFKAEPAGPEVFRVLITRENYSVRQVGSKDVIKRKPDPNGDKEQLGNYSTFNDKYDFKDWTLRGVLSVRINPHNGEIEHAEYVAGKNPRSWQATRFFQEDLSRFNFSFPKNAVLTREFWVTFEWRIKKRPGMSDAEAKQRAVDFLKQQLD